MIPPELRDRLKRHDQEHLLTILDRLTEPDRANLTRELERIDLAELQTLYARREQKDALPDRNRITPLPYPSLDQAQLDAYRTRGEQAFRASEVAFLVVAGGQGTRLGFDHPKGMFPIGPISKKTLFQIHCEKVLALRRRFDAKLPLLVMTSPATDAETRDYLAKQAYFGLPREDVWFFCQETMPALDLATGRLLLEAPGRLCLSPNGHGGTITGLAEQRLLNRLEECGIHTISYFQVDNPLTNLADYVFIGRHLNGMAEVSSKVIAKTGPMEKVGNFLLVDGRCAMIEYSDLPDAWAREVDDNGQLRFWAGNPAIHLFDVAFLRKIARDADRLPWHIAKKKVPYLDDAGKLVTPTKENALKFERFIFDSLPQAERWTIHPTRREEEFAPVKNAEGTDSPATSQKMISNLAAHWLREIGVQVPIDAHGTTDLALEVSPLVALEPEDLREHMHGAHKVIRDRYFG